MIYLAFIALVLGVLSWLVPNHYPPWTSFHGEAVMFAALLVWGLAQGRRWLSAEALPKVWWVLGTLGAIVLLQWQQGLVTFHGELVLAGLYLGGFGLAWSFGHSMGDSPAKSTQQLAWAAAGLGVAACLSVYVAALQWLNVEESVGALVVERGITMRSIGNLGQPNLLGTLLLMGLVAVYGLFRCQRLGAAVFGLLALLLNAGIILSESRAALLSAACVLLYLLWAEWRTGRRPPWGWGVAWFVTLWVLRQGHAAFGAAVGLEAPRALQLGADSVRVTLWRQVVEGISQSPWLGYGWRATPAAQRAGAEVWPGPVSTDYAHNLLLDLLAWLGVPLGLVLIGLLIWGLVRLAWRARQPVDVVLLALTIPVLVHSQLEFPFAYAFFLFPVAAVWGGLSARLVPMTASKGLYPAWVGRMSQALLAGVFVTWSTLAICLVWEYVEVEDAYRVMRFEMRKVGARPAEFVDPDLLLLDQFDAMLTLGRMEPRRGMSAGELEHIRQTNRYFNWGGLHRKYIVALALNDQASEALRQLRVMGNVYGRATYEEELRVLGDMATADYPELTEVLRQAPSPDVFYDNRPPPKEALTLPQNDPTSRPASPAGGRS